MASRRPEGRTAQAAPASVTASGRAPARTYGQKKVLEILSEIQEPVSRLTAFAAEIDRLHQKVEDLEGAERLEVPALLDRLFPNALNDD